MRVSSAQQHSRLLQELQSTSQQQLEGWNKVATGQRISQPAEAPGDAVQLLGINREVSRVDHYLTTIETLNGQLAQEDSLLHSYNSYLRDIRSLILQANHPALGQEGLDALARELEQWTGAIIDLLNSRDAEGHYLFAGYQTGIPPVSENLHGGYFFNDDPNIRQVLVAPETLVDATDTATALCFSINESINDNGASFNLLTILNELHDILLKPDEDLSDQLASHLNKMDQAMARVGSVQTGLGARMKVLDSTRENHRQARLYFQQQAGQLGDLDYAEALSQLNRQKIQLEAVRKGLVEVANLSLFKYL